jgi:hypothetical protein
MYAVDPVAAQIKIKNVIKLNFQKAPHQFLDTGPNCIQIHREHYK